MSRARILKQAGFHSAEDIVAAGFDKFKLLVNFGEGGDMAVQRVWDGAAEAVEKMQGVQKADFV